MRRDWPLTCQIWTCWRLLKVAQLDELPAVQGEDLAPRDVVPWAVCLPRGGGRLEGLRPAWRTSVEPRSLQGVVWCLHSPRFCHGVESRPASLIFIAVVAWLFIVAITYPPRPAALDTDDMIQPAKAGVNIRPNVKGVCWVGWWVSPWWLFKLLGEHQTALRIKWENPLWFNNFFCSFALGYDCFPNRHFF